MSYYSSFVSVLTFFAGRGKRLCNALVKVQISPRLPKGTVNYYAAVQVLRFVKILVSCAYDCTKRFVKDGDMKFDRFPCNPERRRRWALVKLQLNPPFQDLAYRWRVSISTVTRMFHNGSML